MGIDDQVDAYFELLAEIKAKAKELREMRKSSKNLESEIICHMVDKNLTEYTSSSNQVFLKPTLSFDKK